MNSKPEPNNEASFEDNIDDFDFDFDDDYEPEVTSEYVVMDALGFDREAGTAECDFDVDEDESPDEKDSADDFAGDEESGN